jgi:hypothetical protein
MAISYDKKMRAHAKENNMQLCSVAARGIQWQSPVSNIQAWLVEDCALHAMCMKDDLPFDRLKKIKLPMDVANILEDCKLSIVRHRASNFTDIEQHEWLLILNALRHFVLMPKK